MVSSRIDQLYLGIQELEEPDGNSTLPEPPTEPPH